MAEARAGQVRCKACQLVGEPCLFCLRATLQGLFDHVHGIAALYIPGQVLEERLNDSLSLPRQAVLQDSLQHVVPVEVTAKLPGISKHLVYEADGARVLRRILEKAAEDAATIAFPNETLATDEQLLCDEACGLGCEHLDDSLDHVVRMRRAHGLDHVALEVCRNVSLGLAAKVLVRHGFLHHSATPGVKGQAPPHTRHTHLCDREEALSATLPHLPSKPVAELRDVLIVIVVHVACGSSGSSCRHNCCGFLHIGHRGSRHVGVGAATSTALALRAVLRLELLPPRPAAPSSATVCPARPPRGCCSTATGLLAPSSSGLLPSPGLTAVCACPIIARCSVVARRSVLARSSVVTGRGVFRRCGVVARRVVAQ
mmetsp:Transcript_72025/g.154169  ORF Transcript_72025/g.154169 Transcript_72025/m.154169 type:complete len:371 (-) Transcript_72025:404-1516(-)